MSEYFNKSLLILFCLELILYTFLFLEVTHGQAIAKVLPLHEGNIFSLCFFLICINFLIFYLLITIHSTLVCVWKKNAFEYYANHDCHFNNFKREELWSNTLLQNTGWLPFFVYVCWLSIWCCLAVDALREIAKEVGKRDWNFSLNLCDNNFNSATSLYNNTLECDCSSGDVCHVVAMYYFIFPFTLQTFLLILE